MEASSGMQCPWCQISFPLSEIMDHEDNCDKKQEECLTCLLSFPKAELKAHQAIHFTRRENFVPDFEPNVAEANVELTDCPFGCGRSFPPINELIMEHIITAHPEQPGLNPNPFVLNDDEVNQMFRNTYAPSDDSDENDNSDYYDDDDNGVNIDDVRSIHIPSSINIQTTNQRHSEINNEATSSSNASVPNPATNIPKPAPRISKPSTNIPKPATESVPKTPIYNEGDDKRYNLDDTFDETLKKSANKSNVKRPIPNNKFDASVFYRPSENQSRNYESETKGSDNKGSLSDDEDDATSETIEQFLLRSKELLLRRLEEIKNLEHKEPEPLNRERVY